MRPVAITTQEVTPSAMPNNGIRIHLKDSDVRMLSRGIKGAKGVAERTNRLIEIMKVSAEPVRQEMEDLAPVRTGALGQSMRSRKLQKTSPGVVGIRVGPTRGEKLAGWRAHFIEAGTKHHAPKPFIRKAIARKLPQTLRALRLNLQILLKKTTTTI